MKGDSTMKERPILFSGEMVRAILDGRKTMTRRVIRFPKGADNDCYPGIAAGHFWWFRDGFSTGQRIRCPYGQPGDRLWVRETYKIVEPGFMQEREEVYYRADFRYLKPGENGPWKPSIFMPRRASRTSLEIVSVKVERLQDITERDIIAEGIHRELGGWGNSFGYYTNAFKALWDSINAKRGYGWSVNPWVWVIEFTRVT